MKNLYAPWRESYAEKVDKKSNTVCVFCDHAKENHDEQNFILGRYEHGYVMLNLYPYNAGHLLVVPYAHVASLEQLDAQVRQELMELVSKCCEIVTKVLEAQGINVGINVGKAAGAGIPDHLHIHVLPRWQHDTNFMPLLAQTKHISFDLKKIFQELKPHFT